MALDPVEVGKKIFNDIGTPLVSSLEKQGITADYLAVKLKQELEALDEKVFQYKGGIISKADLKAWEIRQRARMDAHKLLGHYPSEKHHVTIEGDLTLQPLTDEQKIEVEAIKEVRKRKAIEDSLK